MQDASPAASQVMEVDQEEDQEEDQEKPTMLSDDDYSAAFETLKEPMIRHIFDIDFSKYSRFLDPARFRWFSTQGTMTLETASKVLPPIFRLTTLRRVKGRKMQGPDGETVIGDEIPPLRFVRVELSMDSEQKKKHDAAQLSILAQRKPIRSVKRDDEEDQGIRDVVVHRWLNHIALNPALDQFRTKGLRENGEHSGALGPEVAAWYEHPDGGAAFFQRQTCSDLMAPLYRDRFSHALYQATYSPKLQWLAGKLKEVCLDARGKLIIFSHWPLNQWMVGLFLSTLGIPFLSYRSQFLQSERDTAVEAFNDPLHESMVLVIGSRVGSSSTNLQFSCSDMFILDGVDSSDWWIQMGGRLHRIGATRPQTVYIPTLLESFDVDLQRKNAAKMYSQLAGRAELEVTEEDLVGLQEELGVEMPESEEKQKRLALEKKIAGLYQRLFGLSQPIRGVF